MDNIHLAGLGKLKKFPAGPNSPIPGPTLPIEVAAALSASLNSNPKNVNAIDPKQIRKGKRIRMLKGCI